MTKFIKFSGIASALALILPIAANAQSIYASTTAQTAVNAGFSDVGGMIVIAVTAVVAAWAALTGLGFAKRKATHYITGRKF